MFSYLNSEFTSYCFHDLSSNVNEEQLAKSVLVNSLGIVGSGNSFEALDPLQSYSDLIKIHTDMKHLLFVFSSKVSAKIRNFLLFFNKE